MCVSVPGMLVATMVATLAWLAAGALAAVPVSVQEHNPHNVTVTKVHMVLSSHLDFGAKTPGCGMVRLGEPQFCARVIPNLPKHPGGMGEPWAYQIINRCKHNSFPPSPCSSPH